MYDMRRIRFAHAQNKDRACAEDIFIYLYVLEIRLYIVILLVLNEINDFL